MPQGKTIRIILDTNILISFLIGKELAKLKDILNHPTIRLITTHQLLLELKLVTSREKLRKYFREDKVNELLSFLILIAGNVTIKHEVKLCRDPKDDFILALAKESKADFGISGDKDLLAVSPLGKTKIISPAGFEEVLRMLKSI